MQVQNKIDDFNNAGIERVYDGGLPLDVCDKHVTVSVPSIETLDHTHTHKRIWAALLRSSYVKTCIS